VAILKRSIKSFRRETLPEKAVLFRRSKESKMPKQRRKSGAKKRFKFTANGHVKVGQAGKRHCMIKRTTKVHPERAGHDGALRFRRAHRQEIHALQPLI